MRKFQKWGCYHNDPDESEDSDDWGEDPDGGGYDDHDVETPDTESGQGVNED